MDKLIIQGGVPLRGIVDIKGSKNASLYAIAACILSEGECRLDNVPRLDDVSTMLKVMKELGLESSFGKDGVLIIQPGLKSCLAPYELVRAMRASFLALSPLLARMGEAKVSLPGGCAIGSRPVDIHLKGLAQLGADINIVKGYVEASTKGLTGAELYLDYPTVTGTVQLMMAAVLARGKTIIENAACEPEVEDLAKFLNLMGANVQGAGTDVIEVEGVSGLRGGSFSVIPDRIEAATFAAAGAITSGELTVRGVVPEHLKTVLLKLEEAGVQIECSEDELRVSVPDGLKPIHVKTLPYPGFPTDMQAQIMAVMSVTPGRSTVTETVFENRFMHVAELKRMGADIRAEGRTAMINGVPKLTGASVMTSDLRAGAGLILAGLVAEGETHLLRLYHIDRGYERIEARLAALGAKVERVKDK